MPLILPNDFVNGEIADAVPVEQNYQLIEGYINDHVVNSDGSVAMQAPLLLAGDPTQANHAANKDYVDAILPVGIMMPYGGIVAPAGSWALCNGASVSTTAYPALFAVVGYRFGGSGGSFLLPDMTGRMMVGVNSAKSVIDTVGKAGGTWTAQLPAHTHGLGLFTGTESASHTHGISPTGTITTSSDGAHSHNSAYVNHSLPGAGSEGVDRSMNAAPPYPTGYLQAGTDTQGAHTHTYSGNTSAELATHQHFVSGDTASVGTAGVETLPPYVTVNFIIRAA